MWSDEVKAALDIIKKDLLLARKGKKQLTGKQKRELVALYNTIRKNADLIK